MKAIKLMTLVALMLLVACSGASTPKAEVVQEHPKKKDIAVQLYSLRDDIGKDYPNVIKELGQMGFTAIEAFGYNDGKFFGRTPAEFKADIEAAGMRVMSSHTARQLSEKEIKSKDFSESLAWWDKTIADHKAAGMTYVVVPWMEKTKTLKDLQTYCEYFNEIGKRCKENGMQFGYHNHAHEFDKIEDVVMLDYMIENTNPEYVFFELDVYWTVMGRQSPVDYFNKYKHRFKLLHIKDNKELGQSGMVGFDAIFNNIETSGAKAIIVEVEKYNFAPMESVKKSLEYLQNNSLVKASYQ